MVKTPNVLILKPIAPSAESSRQGVLKYDKLDEYNTKNSKHEYARLNEIWDAEDGSLDEDAAVRQLANQYLVATAAIINTVQKPGSIDLWSNRYTDASRELLGEPDAEYAKQLLRAQAADILQTTSGEQAEYKAQLTGMGIEVDNTKHEREFENAAEQVCEYYMQKYSAVFDTLMDGLNDDDVVTANDVYERFGRALEVLDEMDEAWREWKVERNDDGNQLSVAAGDKKIIVGMKRADMSAKKLRGLFGHEALVHALRGKNGSTVSKELGTGLPGYLDAEEGLGVFVEYAVTGEVPEKNVDRYTDMALALGQIDGRMRTREELLEYAMVREKLRNSSRTTDKKTDEALEADVYAHVNRIYRGTRGDEHVGVFTKDVSYHKGFMLMGQYIQDQLASGKSINDVMEFVLQGKFDPTNDRHLEVVRDK